jgi:PPP family 3-phenylpropionic acid transporter
MAQPRTAPLAGFYFFHYGLLGLLMPYLPLYLQERGLAGAASGGMMGLLMGAKLVSPPLVGAWIDRRGELLCPLRISLLATLLAWGLFMRARSGMTLALTFAAFSLAWNATLPTFETLTLHRLGPTRIGEYGRIRLWGSLGFIVAGVSGAAWLTGPEATIQRLPLAGLILALGMVACGLIQRPVRPALRSTAPQGSSALLRRPGVRGFLLSVFLLNLSHGPYYAFFTLYLEGFGYGRQTIGLLWALGVVAEIGLFWAMPGLFERFGRRRLLLAALLLTVLRWTLISTLAGHPAPLIAAQILHLASFGLCHAVGMSYVHALFPAALQGRGQAFYSALGFGAGGIVGSALGGLLWSAGWRGGVFAMSAMSALLAVGVAWRGIPVLLQSGEPHVESAHRPS